MSKRFFVITENLNAEAEKKFQAFCKSYKWWHWLPNSWLIKDEEEKLTADAIREAFYAITRNAECLIMEIKPKTWAAQVKVKDNGSRLTDWIKSTWDEDEDS